VTVVLQATCVAIGRRGVLIRGEPGSGKSSLALALIDRGAVLVGDDGVELSAQGEQLNANPPPNTAGLLEVRNVGLIKLPTARGVPIALVVELNEAAPRFIDMAPPVNVNDYLIPLIMLWPHSPVLALRVEAALEKYGLR
jgi:serine kinase of HPr protein (carbohydrate metabolism regulator)